MPVLASVNVINGGAGDDTLIGNGGADVLYGANDDDVLAISDTTFQVNSAGLWRAKPQQTRQASHLLQKSYTA